MAILTLSELRDATRDRADQKNSDFIGDDEANRYINSSITELKDMLITAYGEDYYSQEADVVFANSVNKMPLPLDFYKMVGVDLKLDANNFIPLKPYNFHERNRYQSNYNRTRRDSYSIYKYRIMGNNLFLQPEVTGSLTLHLYYIPKATYLVDDSDEFEGYNGWEEYVIIRAAIMMMNKEESDVSSLMNELSIMKERLDAIRFNRDAGEVSTITDSSREYAYYDRDEIWP